MPGDDKFVDCHIGGRPYRMGFDFNVLVDAEKATGENLLEGAARLGAGSSGGQLRGLVYAVLKPHNPRVTLEEAAQNLGCPPLRTLRKITVPLIAANLLAGGLLAFSFAMLEVSDSLILAQRQQDFPITKAIYELYQLLGEGRFVASALGVWAIGFLILTLLYKVAVSVREQENA